MRIWGSGEEAAWWVRGTNQGILVIGRVLLVELSDSGDELLLALGSLGEAEEVFD